MADGLEPHGTISWPYRTADVHDADWPGRGGVPGVWDDGVGWEGVLGGLYRYPGPTVPGPIFIHIQPRPYPRPYEGNSQEMMRFLR